MNMNSRKKYSSGVKAIRGTSIFVVVGNMVSPGQFLTPNDYMYIYMICHDAYTCHLCVGNFVRTHNPVAVFFRDP